MRAAAHPRFNAPHTSFPPCTDHKANHHPNMVAPTRATMTFPLVSLLLALSPAPSTQYQLHRRTILTAAPAAAAAAAAASTAAPPALAAPSGAVIGGARVPIDGAKDGFPLASFGLQVYDDETAYRLTLTALEVGYRNFFASVLAGNQKGFARAVKASGIPRDQLYICGTVLSNRVRGEQAAFDKTQKGCNENMIAMAAGDIGHLDQIMLDYPGPDAESVQGQWRAFEQMKSDGLVDTLAVSNFSPGQLDAVLALKGTKPAVNQLPFSLANNPPGLLEYNKERGVLVQSWSPLSRVLTNPTYRTELASIGSNYGKSAAQVGLRYIVQRGASFCTQSKSKSHFEEDLNVFDFELTTKEMAQLGKL